MFGDFRVADTAPCSSVLSRGALLLGMMSTFPGYHEARCEMACYFFFALHSYGVTVQRRLCPTTVGAECKPEVLLNRLNFSLDFAFHPKTSIVITVLLCHWYGGLVESRLYWVFKIPVYTSSLERSTEISHSPMIH